jgi:prepilin-type N-terminal cleavage/methylation domain-containing protein
VYPTPPGSALKNLIGRGSPFLPRLGKEYEWVGREEKMNKGFTLIETLVSSALLLLAVLFSARVMFFALGQSRQADLRFRLVETAEYYKNHLSAQSFSAPDLADGGHRQTSRTFIVTWRVEPAAAGLKRVDLRVAGQDCAQAIGFFKSNFIQEVKHD